MSDISELLEKVKAATGPDRELDYKLVCALISEDEGLKHEVYGIAAYDFTSSIDAALALVERKLPGWRAELRWGIWPKHAKRFDATLWNNDPNTRESVFGVSGNAATLPLAILTALLMARSKETSNG